MRQAFICDRIVVQVPTYRVESDFVKESTYRVESGPVIINMAESEQNSRTGVCFHYQSV